MNVLKTRTVTATARIATARIAYSSVAHLNFHAVRELSLITVTSSYWVGLINDCINYKRILK